MEWIHRISEELRPKVEQEIETVYMDIEMPLVPVLADIEWNGILLDVPVLESMSVDMAKQQEKLTTRIYELADCEFNINSPKQLGRSAVRETQPSPAPASCGSPVSTPTAVEVLEELAHSYELPRLVLDYRQLSKFKSTYVDVSAQADRAEHEAVAHLVQPGRGRDGPSFEQQPEPTEHPDPLGHGTGNPERVHPTRRHDDAFGPTIRRWNCASWPTCPGMPA